MEENSIKSKAIRGTIWVGLEKLIRQVVQFVFGIILARLLSPGDYGIVGMLAIVIALSTTIVDSGMASALIQKQERVKEDYSTVFVFNFVTSVFIYFTLFISAPCIASFYKTPLLVPITRIISVTFVINAFSTINQIKLSIDLKFREQSIISIISLLISGTIGIILAFCGYGVWTLVFQTIVSAVVNTTLLFLFTKWFPGMTFSIESFKSLFGFGSRILGTSLLYVIYSNMYTLVIGRVFSPAQVGFYNRGNQYAMLPVQTFAELAHKVYFPVLSKVQNDNSQLLRVYAKMTQLPLFLLYPILVGIAAIAEPLIILMIGDKWLPCVPILQILCIGYMFGILSDLNLNLLLVKGRSDLILRLDLFKKPIAFCLLFISIQFGIIWMVVLKSIYELIAFFFNCYYTKKILNYGAIQQMRDTSHIFFRSFLMGAIVYISVYFISILWIKVLVGVLVGSFSYWGISVFTKDNNYNELKKIILNFIRKN